MRATAIGVIIMIGLAGCGSGGSTKEATMDRAEAGRIVIEHVNRTAALIPGARLEDRRENDVPCGMSSDTKTATVEHHYLVRDTPPEESVPTLRRIREWWLANGYEVKNERVDAEGNLQGVSVRSKEDGFSVYVQVNVQRRLVIVGSSPCLPWDPMKD